MSQPEFVVAPAEAPAADFTAHCSARCPTPSVSVQYVNGGSSPFFWTAFGFALCALLTCGLRAYRRFAANSAVPERQQASAVSSTLALEGPQLISESAPAAAFTPSVRRKLRAQQQALSSDAA